MVRCAGQGMGMAQSFHAPSRGPSLPAPQELTSPELFESILWNLGRLQCVDVLIKSLVIECNPPPYSMGVGIG